MHRLQIILDTKSIAFEKQHIINHVLWKMEVKHD